MADGGREVITLESDKYKSDPVVNQHIMHMIDTEIHWYEQTFREILMEHQKIRNGETPMKNSEEANKKRKTHAQDDKTNDKANDMDNKTPTMPKHTTNMVKHLNIPVSELRLGAEQQDWSLRLLKLT